MTTSIDTAWEERLPIVAAGLQTEGNGKDETVDA